jgi:hypothetical protein
MKKLTLLGFVLGLFGVVGLAAADDKADPTGTWKFKVKYGNKEVEQTLKLKSADGKLTGTISGGGKKGKDTDIENGTFKKGEVSFTVTRERKGEKTTMTYTGKLTGDAIKGSIAVEGKDDKIDWEAKRDK